MQDIKIISVKISPDILVTIEKHRGGEFTNMAVYMWKIQTGFPLEQAIHRDFKSENFQTARGALVDMCHYCNEVLYWKLPKWISVLEHEMSDT